MADQQNTPSEFQEMKVKGNQVVSKVRDIIEEGNARRVIIKREGRTMLEFPLSVGVGGAAAAVLLAPTLAALGAFAALVSDVSIVVERAQAAPGTATSSDPLSPGSETPGNIVKP